MSASLDFSAHRTAVFRSLAFAAAVSLWLAAPFCEAADGDLDSSFDQDGLQQIKFDLGNGNTDTPRTIVVDEDNHLVVGGYASSTDFHVELVMARLTPDGVEEWKQHLPASPNFPGQGLALTARSMTGPCLSGTRLNTLSGQRDAYVICTDNSGQPNDYDVSVASSESVGWHAATSALATPFFYAAGTIGTANSPSRDFVVARFDASAADISFDPTFGPNAGMKRIDAGGFNVADDVTAMVAAIGGVYVVGSTHSQDEGLATDYDFAVAVVGDDGTVETKKIDFNVLGSNLDDRAYGIARDGQGRILVAGTATKDQAGDDRDIALARRLSLSDPDPSFSQSGLDLGRRLFNFSAAHPEWDESVRGMAVDSYGRIYIVGTLFYPDQPDNPNDIAVLRLKADGEIDAAFGSAGRVTLDIGTTFSSGKSREEGVAIALQDDRPVILAEYEHNGTDTDFFVARLTTSEPAEIFADGFE
jgi:uncharacterized delta-60 repeat protein